jgi:dTDP-glucose 4,6-dehydratase
MNTLIITGSAGFVGINTLEKLSERQNLAKNYNRIISIDKMGYATEFNRSFYYQILNKLDKFTKVISLECDINSNEFKHKKYQHYDDESIDILDFASESHVDNSIKDPFFIYTQNCAIPSNLLSWIGKDKWKSIKTYYHISTDEVYSEIPLENVHDKKYWFTVDTPLKPNNPYSASKAAQDCFLMSIKHTYGLNVKFIRMANQQPGKYQHKEKMLMASILRVLNGDTVKVYGNGKNIRQWTPVEITAGIILDVLGGVITVDDSVIHIANKNGVFTNNEIVSMLERVMSGYGYELKKEYIQDRLGHDTAYALITEEYIDKYFDGVSVEEYMKTCVDFCIKNKQIFF